MSGTCIASHVPGRLRIRHPGLRSAVRNAGASALLADWDGVLSAEGKPASGSIVLRYDPGRITAADIESRTTALFAPDQGDKDDPAAPGGDGLSLWSLNRPAKIGMLSALAGTLIALSVGKKLHAAFGAMHVAFLLVHLANHRNKILQ